MNRFRWLDVISEDNSIICAILGLPGDDDDNEFLLVTADAIAGWMGELELELLVGD